MTPEEMNRAIAEWLGWTELSNPNVPHVPLSGRDPDGCMNRVPNYTGSLDAMHEAEKVIEDKLLYAYWLSMLQRADHKNEFWAYIHATASQRAEAFLRAVGRWHEKGEK